MIYIQNLVNYRKFRHIQVYSRPIQAYSGPFRHSHILACLEPRVTFKYSELRHIQNPGIFRTQDIFRPLSRHILTYSELCITLAY